MRAPSGRAAWLTVALGALLWVGDAHAEPRDEAKRYFLQGLEAAKAQDYEGALKKFEAAQNIYPHPATIYNIARAHQDLGNLDEAIDAFKMYAELVPEKEEALAPMIRTLEAQRRRGTEVAAVAEPVATEGGGVATSEELERLQAIASELARISKDLSERKDAPVASAETGGDGETGEGGETSGEVDPADLGLGDGEFLADAYENIVVTASRYGQSPLDSPSTITVLTEEDIRSSGATNIPDLLRRVVGVEVMSLSAGQPDVSIRGFNRELSNKVLVLLDGRSLYLDLLGNTAWATLPVSLEEIERIEIIRGPGSAVYGANAMTGVINIITRTPGSGDNIVTVEAGTPGYGRGTAMVTGRKDEYAYRMAFNYDQTGAWNTEQPVTDGLAFQPNHDDTDLSMRSLKANGRVDRTFAGGKGFASLTGGYVVGSTEFYVIGTLGDWRMPFEAGWLRGDASYGDFHMRAYWNGLQGSPDPWGGYVGGRQLSSELDSDILDIELEGRHDLETGSLSHTVNYGLGYRYKQIAWSLIDEDLEPVTENHNSVFVQDTIGLDKLSLVASLRADLHPLIDLNETLSPRASAIYRIAEKTSVRATGGTSFRGPTFMEAYADVCLPSGSYDAVCIQDYGSERPVGAEQPLSPERITTVEVGLHDESSDFHRADVAAYANRVTDLIYVSSVDSEIGFFDPEIDGFSAGTARFINLDESYLAYGLEAEGRIFPVDGLDLYANAHYQRVDENNGSQVVQDRSASTLKLNSGVIYRSPWRVDVSGHVHYLSPQTWRLREYDEVGQIEIVPQDISARTIASAWLAARPFKDEALELEFSAWNIGSLISGEGVREHPKGQLVNGRLVGAVSYKF